MCMAAQAQCARKHTTRTCSARAAAAAVVGVSTAGGEDIGSVPGAAAARAFRDACTSAAAAMLLPGFAAGSDCARVHCHPPGSH